MLPRLTPLVTRPTMAATIPPKRTWPGPIPDTGRYDWVGEFGGRSKGSCLLYVGEAGRCREALSAEGDRCVCWREPEGMARSSRCKGEGVVRDMAGQSRL